MSRLAILGAIGLSLGAHVLALSFGRQEDPPPSVQIAATEGLGIASLGNAFEDMVTGSPEVVPPEEIAVVSLETVPEVALDVPHLTVSDVVVVLAAEAIEEITLLEDVPTLEVLPELETLPLEEVPPQEPVEERLEKIASFEEPPLEPLPEEISPQAVLQAVRPPVRPAQEPPRERPRRQEAQAAPAVQGGTETRRRGQDSGQQTAPANAGQGNASRAQASEAGNAAASSYPGEVMRKLSRARRPNVSGRGTAVIAFSLAASGAVQSVSVQSSSGNARIDEAGVELVRRAGPFAPPPAGARTTFTYEFSTR